MGVPAPGEHTREAVPDGEPRGETGSPRRAYEDGTGTGPLVNQTFRSVRARPRAWPVGVTLKVTILCDLERVLRREIFVCFDPEGVPSRGAGPHTAGVCVPNGGGRLYPTGSVLDACCCSVRCCG